MGYAIVTPAAQRWVAHVDMDAFFASVEQLTRPTLRGRPVLVGGVSGRGVVAGCSYEAREYGARSAMPTAQAVRLCRGKAVMVTPRFVVYKAVSARVFAVLRRMAETVEPLSIDEGFLEVEVDSAKEAEQWARELQDTIEKETGLAASVGVASTKLDAKMASDLAKPHGVCVVPAEGRREVFGPRPVGEVWGIGRVAQAKLADIGVTTIAEFIDLDHYDVRATLGSVGVDIQRMASGDDNRPVAPRGAAKQISSERTLDEDITTSDEARNVLAATARSSHRRLLKDGRVARTITVKTRTADFAIHTRSATLGIGTDDLENIIRVALRLLTTPDPDNGFRLIGVGLSGLSHDRQEQLFPELAEAQIVHIHTSSADSMEDADGPDASGVISNSAELLPEELLDVPEIRPAHIPATRGGWQQTQDVYHPEFGHGWVQGTGLGKVTVRFETRATGPGKAKNFAVDDPDLRPAHPIDSLAWDDLLLPGEGEPGQ